MLEIGLFSKKKKKKKKKTMQLYLQLSQLYPPTRSAELACMICIMGPSWSNGGRGFRNGKRRQYKPVSGRSLVNPIYFIGKKKIKKIKKEKRKRKRKKPPMLN